MSTIEATNVAAFYAAITCPIYTTVCAAIKSAIVSAFETTVNSADRTAHLSPFCAANFPTVNTTVPSA